MLGELSFPAPVGVGSNDPHPVASVRCADVPSSEHTPRCIKPQVGKPSEDNIQSSSAKHRGVLREDIRRPNLANDAEHFEPEARTLAIKARTPTSAGYILARKAARNDVHQSAPGSPVEGPDVIPDGEGIEVPVALSLGEHALAVGIDLDSADRSPSKQPGGKQASAGAGK
ncbi:MAG TPA: hypothetical protein VGK73_38510 [Polyangiaceae bacterium]